LTISVFVLAITGFLAEDAQDKRRRGRLRGGFERELAMKLNRARFAFFSFFFLLMNGTLAFIAYLLHSSGGLLDSLPSR